MSVSSFSVPIGLLSMIGSQVPLNIDGDVTLSHQWIVHPLVIMGISHHYSSCSTYVRKASTKGPSSLLPSLGIGFIAGTQEAKKTEILSSLELILNTDDGSLVQSTDCHTLGGIINEVKAAKQRTQFAEVYPNLEILGWYTFGTLTPSKDFFNTVNAQIMRLFDVHNPVFVIMDPSNSSCHSTTAVNYLPPPVFLLISRQTDARVDLVRLPYTVHSEESERIGTELAMKVGEISAPNSSTNSTDIKSGSQRSLKPEAARVQSSGELLARRIRVVKEYIRQVHDGTIKGDPELLRQISGLCNLLPASSSAEFDRAASIVYIDALMLTYTTVLNRCGGSLRGMVSAAGAAVKVPNLRCGGGLANLKSSDCADVYQSKW
eukprot:Tbor_TRINITY_DN1980_c0_g1::TRINITY_DN1980_c0_g1_i1::g.3565::m.3565/K12179/COPS6, CSN6; COP9 signalosome complex subunit 6